MTPEDFITANARLTAPPLVPEIRLHLATEVVPLWRATEEELAAAGLPPPYWAFAWAGGQALARYVLDNAALVRGKRVLDLASGSGLVAIAAMKAGARTTTAAEIDAFAREAAMMNADANDVELTCMADDLLAGPGTSEWDVVLAGDIFYERDTAERVLAFVARQAGRGTTVLIGDPGRSYLPKGRLTRLAEYSVPVTRELEDNEIKRTAVWTLRM